MYVDYVVQRRGPSGLLPHISRQHFAGNNSAVVPREVFEQFELADCKLQANTLAQHGSGHRIDLKAPNSDQSHRLSFTSAQESSNTGAQLWKCEGLDQIIVGSGI